MPVMVKALGYYSHKGGQAARGLTKVKSHLKYLEHGKVHGFKPRGFDGARNDVTRAEFQQVLEQQPARGVIAHKLVLSLSQDERDRLGVDLKTLVRETMKAWSEQLGRALTWIGFQHEDKGHPHVHVVVAGYAEGKQVGLYEKDLVRLRGWSEREKERQADRNQALPHCLEHVRADRQEASRLMELTNGRARTRGIQLER